jgi:hypothetical protein
MSKPPERGRSNSQGSVKLIVPCCVTAPARILIATSQPRPRKLRWARSIVPTRESTDE